MRGSGSAQALPDAGDGPAPEPVLAIARGNPSAEETAAVVVVLSALAARLERAARPGPGLSAQMGPRSEWSARYRLLRSPLRRGPGGWRASALPR